MHSAPRFTGSALSAAYVKSRQLSRPLNSTVSLLPILSSQFTLNSRENHKTSEKTHTLSSHCISIYRTIFLRSVVPYHFRTL